MFKSRFTSARFQMSKNFLMIGGSLIVIAGLFGVLWQQKTSQLVQAISELPAQTQPLARQTTETATPTTPDQTTPQPATAVATIQPAQPQQSQTASVVKPAPAVPSCTRVAHVLPQPIDLINRPDGLTYIIEPTLYFRVYGRDSRTIQQQIWRCSPDIGHRQLHAISQSRIDLSYGQFQLPLSDTCKLTNVKVGLRTLMTLPTWQADEWTPTTTKQAMNRFLSGILVHERGHGQIDRQYAKKLLHRLQAIQAPCASLLSEVQMVANQVQAELRSAQQAYELKTNYGANQGAWL
jgi:hypothetical protein